MNRPLNIFIPHCSGCLTDTLPHGDGLVAHGFITRLAERGHHLYVATERAELSKPMHSNVRLFHIQSLSSSGAARRLHYILDIRSLFRRLRSEIPFDLAHQLNPVYTGVSLALWGSGVPVVLGPYVADWPNDPHAIGASKPGLRAMLGKAKELAAFVQQRNASAILLTTEAARQRVGFGERWKAPVHFLPHGIDSHLFSPADPGVERDCSNKSVILFYANISERKGIADLLQAFEMVAHHFPQSELWVAGEGEQLGAAMDLASSLAARSQIRFLGKQTREQAVLLMQQADIYCLTSYGEPYGMTVVEAMSCGLPVIVTDAGGARYLADDEGGLRVPMKSPAALAQALERLLPDPALRKQMGVCNRQKVLRKFTWERVIDQLEDIYRNTVEGDREFSTSGHPAAVPMAGYMPGGGERR